MRLSVATPLALIVEADAVAHVRAEDASGAFGVLPGHAAFITALTVSVLCWRDHGGVEHYIAVRGGVFQIQEDAVAVSTPEAVASDDLERLESQVLVQFRRGLGQEQEARAGTQRLQVAAIRQIVRLLRPQQGMSVGAARAGAVGLKGGIEAGS